MDNRGRRRRLSYANVMSTIAVFGVLAGGGAWAADKIGSSDIAKNAVRSKHIKKRQVKGSDLSPKAIPFLGRGSFRYGSVLSPTSDPKTLLALPGIGRLTTDGSCPGSGQMRVRLVSSGGTFTVLKLGVANDPSGAGFGPFYERLQASPDGSAQILVTGGPGPFEAAWLTILPAGQTGRPLATVNVTAEHGCQKTTAVGVTTGR